MCERVGGWEWGMEGEVWEINDRAREIGRGTVFEHVEFEMAVSSVRR